MLFYHLGKAVQDFWRLPLWLGQLSYDMSRTHSIMRVATTASPVSGMEVIPPLHLPRISPLPYISPVSPLHLPCLSPTSPLSLPAPRLHLPHISPAPRLHLACTSPASAQVRDKMLEMLEQTHISPISPLYLAYISPGARQDARDAGGDHAPTRAHGAAALPLTLTPDPSP